MIGDAILQPIGVAIIGRSPVSYIATASCRLALARQACLYEGTKANAGCRDRCPVGAKQAVETLLLPEYLSESKGWFATDC